MGLFAIGTQTLGSAARPVWGTTLSAASPVPFPDPFTNSYAPGSMLPPVTLAVVTSVPFRVGDPILVRPATIDATHPQEAATVSAIVDGTHITVVGLTVSHASGQFVINNSNVARLVVQADSANTHLLYLGNDSTVGASATSLIYVIGSPSSAIVQPAEYALNDSIVECPIALGQFWITGTSGEKFLPYAYQL